MEKRGRRGFNLWGERRFCRIQSWLQPQHGGLVERDRGSVGTSCWYQHEVPVLDVQG